MSIPVLIQKLDEKAPINSPIFTGIPQAPTPADGDISKKIATTEFVNTTVDSSTKYVKKTGDSMSDTLIINPSTSNYREGIRINKAPNGWSLVQFGGAAGSESGTDNNSWTVGANTSNQFRIIKGSSEPINDTVNPQFYSGDFGWGITNSLIVCNTLITDPTNYDTTSRLVVQQPTLVDGSKSIQMVYMHPDVDGGAGYHGIVSGTLNKWIIRCAESDPVNMVTNFNMMAEGAGCGIHQVNGVYQSDPAERFYAGAIEVRENGLVGNTQSDIGYAPSIYWHWSGRCTTGIVLNANNELEVLNQQGNDGVFRAGKVWGAVWNDYAEFRAQEETIGPGYCVTSSDNGKVSKTTEKFQACDGIVSDTFGFAIGQNQNCQTPLAVAGRVLAYYSGSRKDYHAGDAVCAGPEGKVMKMTREEIKEWPDRIIGLVSEIPTYDTWGEGKVSTKDRIWIKIK